MRHKIISALLFGLMAQIIVNCHSNKDHKKREVTKVVKSVVDSKLDLNKKLSIRELEEYDKKELRLLRNEIFARRGYIFKSKDLIRYFSRYDWYNPEELSEKEGNGLFNEFERHNVRIIKERESELDKKIEEELVQKKTYEQISFRDYVSIIPNVNLPLKFECEEGFEVSRINTRNDTIKKFKPGGAAIIGKLYSKEDEVAFIYGYPADIFYPMVKKYDLSGNEIGQMYIFDLGDCVGDLDYLASTSGTIHEDFTVETITTIIRCNSETEIQKCDTSRNSYSFNIDL